ncbi:MAG: recombinase, partial [Rikenellaceae bacterium]
MAKIIMKLSPKLNKQTGKAEILFRFIGGYRVELRAKSGIFINPKMWSEEKKGLKTATFGAEEAKIKKSLNALCDTILDAYTITPKEEVSKEWINEVIDRFHFPEKYIAKEEVQKQTFFELFDEFLEARKLSVVREKNFRVLYRTLQRYEIYKDQPLDIDTATDETIRDIYKFIENEHALCDTAKYKRILKMIPEARTPQPR